MLFRANSEAAFANIQLWSALGSIIAFSYQSHLCLPPKLYLQAAVLVTGMVGYGIVEIIEHRKKKGDGSADAYGTICCREYL